LPQRRARHNALRPVTSEASGYAAVALPCDAILHLKTTRERHAKDAELVAAARAVIDFEWQKIKREMHGSRAAAKHQLYR